MLLSVLAGMSRGCHGSAGAEDIAITDVQPANPDHKELVDHLKLYDGLPENTVYDFYHIAGNSYNELCDQIFNKQTGKGSWNEQEKCRYAAEAMYCYTWDGDYDWHGDTVRWKNIRVGIKNSINFPWWDCPQNADKSMVEKWQKFIVSLKDHEFGHVRVYNVKGEEFKKTMASIEARSPWELRAKTQKAFSDFIVSVDAAGIDYDSTTGHGRSEGAVFSRN